MKVMWFQRLAICLCVILLVVHSGRIERWRSDPKQRMVLAQYHFWTGSESIFKTLASNWQPVFPFYDTRNSSTTQRHISWASQNSVDGFIVPWTGENSASDKHLREGLLDSTNLELVRFCLSLTNLSSWSAQVFAGGKVDARSPFAQSLRYIRKEYMAHPSYAVLGKRPMLVIDFHPTSEDITKRVANALRDNLPNVYLIGDVCALESEWDEEKFVVFATKSRAYYDAFYCSKVITRRRSKGKSELSDVFRESILPAFQRWARSVPFIPTVVPFYKDYVGPEKQLLKSKPEDFANEIAAVSRLPRLSIGESDMNVIVVQSFNDWGKQIPS